jgi:hypothetical protein
MVANVFVDGLKASPRNRVGHLVQDRLRPLCKRPIRPLHRRWLRPGRRGVLAHANPLIGRHLVCGILADRLDLLRGQHCVLAACGNKRCLSASAGRLRKDGRHLVPSDRQCLVDRLFVRHRQRVAFSRSPRSPGKRLPEMPPRHTNSVGASRPRDQCALLLFCCLNGFASSHKPSTSRGDSALNHLLFDKRLRIANRRLHRANGKSASGLPTKALHESVCHAL